MLTKFRLVCLVLFKKFLIWVQNGCTFGLYTLNVHYSLGNYIQLAYDCKHTKHFMSALLCHFLNCF